MTLINIWIVEDDTVFRRTLQRMLDRQDGISCKGVFPSCVEFFRALEEEEYPDLILMDLGLPEMSGVEGIERLKKEAPELPVMVLTVFNDKEKILRALDAARASGYLLKTATSPEIVKGIRDVFIGQAVLSPEVAKVVLEKMRQPTDKVDFNLSDREIEVLEHLADGLAVKEIADRLQITTRTARFHLSNIYEKLQVPSQSGAVAKALRSGII